MVRKCVLKRRESVLELEKDSETLQMRRGNVIQVPSSIKLQNRINKTIV